MSNVNVNYTTVGDGFCADMIHSCTERQITCYSLTTATYHFKKTLPEILDFIKSLDIKITQTYPENKWDSYNSFYSYLKGEHYIAFTHYTSKEDETYLAASLNIRTPNKEFFDKITTFFLDNQYIKEDKSRIYSLIQDNGLGTKIIDVKSKNLDLTNYNEKVQEDYKKSVENFNSENPKGRVLILEGSPGTGKTHLVMDLFDKLNGQYLIVPTNLVNQIDSPAFMTLLLGMRRNSKSPLNLVIEDGDICLIKRKGENMSVISALLNLSDGIIGNLMDIRIIVTTNASIHEMDPAVLRKGRLNKRILVDELTYEKATEVVRKLMKNDTFELPTKRKYTLAEIYSIFNNDGELEEEFIPEAKRAIGFGRHYQSDSNDSSLTMNSGVK